MTPKADNNFNPDLPLEAQQVMHDEIDNLVSFLNSYAGGDLHGAIVMVICNDEGAIHYHSWATSGGRRNCAIGMMDAAAAILRDDEGE